jgi:ubiquinone/menaquinone biosynthesis C-methylase UbiE
MKKAFWERFADGSFDAALAANVLHLLPRPERAVAEHRRPHHAAESE